MGNPGLKKQGADSCHLWSGRGTSAEGAPPVGNAGLILVGKRYPTKIAVDVALTRPRTKTWKTTTYEAKKRSLSALW